MTRHVHKAYWIIVVLCCVAGLVFAALALWVGSKKSSTTSNQTSPIAEDAREPVANYKIFTAPKFSFKYPFDWTYQQDNAVSTSSYVVVFSKNGESVAQLENPILGRDYYNFNVVTSAIYKTNDPRTSLLAELMRPCATQNKPCVPLNTGGVLLVRWQEGNSAPDTFGFAAPEKTNSLMFWLKARTVAEDTQDLKTISEMVASLNFKLTNDASLLLETTASTSKWTTFTDPIAAFMISYPKSMLLWPENRMPEPNVSSSLVLKFPASWSYKNNLSSASITVGARPVTSPTDCFYDGISEPKKYIIGKTAFYKLASTGVGAGNIYEQISYNTVRENTCYFIILFAHSVNRLHYDEPNRPAEYDHKALIESFNQIASTFKFTK